MANRTQIVCLHEGKKGRSIDPVFINALLRALAPAWIRPWKGSNILRPVDCGGRKELIAKMPNELRACLNAGGTTTLMVWADVDHDMQNGDELKSAFWTVAEENGITEAEFGTVVFVFAKDRLENWIQFLVDGATDESKEGPRVKNNRVVADAAKALARRCRQKTVEPKLPPSLEWSCQNWRALVEQMRNT